MAVQKLFTDPDGDGVGDWSTDTGTVSDSATKAYVDTAVAGILVSPNFLGVPSAPTATAATNTNQLATTAFVKTAIASIIPSSNDYSTAIAGTNFSVFEIAGGYTRPTTRVDLVFHFVGVDNPEIVSPGVMLQNDQWDQPNT